MADSQHFSDGLTYVEKTEAKEMHRIDGIVNKSTLIAKGNPAQYRLNETSNKEDQSGSYRKITFGERDPKKAHKIFLMVGETGAGKTSLINTVINYTCGVKREDKIWIEITNDQSDRSSAESQTSIITVYGLYIEEASVDLTIIDTPGYGDTRDISLDKEIAEGLLRLFTSDDTAHQIHAVCFVIKADQNRLTDRLQYIFDAVQALFGKDVAENIVLLFTHSTGFPPKNALTAVKAAKIKCAVDEKNQPIFFLFDNRLGETLDEEYQSMQDQSWNLSYRGMKGFFRFLGKIQPKALKMTLDVLLNRKQLEANISNLKSRFQDMELTRNELKETQEVLEKYKTDAKGNINFQYEVEVHYKVKDDIDPALAYKATCCSVCEENCHYPGCWWISSVSWCHVMKDNHCTVCTNKCHYSKHVKEDKIYVTKTKKEKKTYEDLKKKYEDAMNKTVDYEFLVNKLNEELQKSEKEKMKLLNEAFQCVDGLEKIALKSDSIFTLVHIDFLIEKFKEIKEPEKAEALENIKKRAGEKKGMLSTFTSFFTK